MLLLEFLCCKFSSDLIGSDTDETYLAGVLLDHEAECVAYDLAARELWSRGFVVLQVRHVSRCTQRDCRASDLLSGLWDQAEHIGISVLVTESSVRFRGSTIRRVADKPIRTSEAFASLED